MMNFLFTGVFAFIIGFQPGNLYSQSLPPGSGMSSCNIVVNAGPDVTLCDPGTLTLSGTTSGDVIFTQWDHGNTLTDEYYLTPTATVAASTTYILKAWGVDPAFPSLIVNGDFEQGNTGFSTSYYYVENVSTSTSELGGDGAYTTVNNPKLVHGSWSTCYDHTPDGSEMLVVNGAAALQDVWCQNVSVTPETFYNISAWVTSVHPSSPASLRFSINGDAIGNNVNAFPLTCLWKPFNGIWYSGSNTTASICILNMNTSTGGNDFAIDDIAMHQLCSVYDEVSIIINDETAPVAMVTGEQAVCEDEVVTYAADIPPGYIVQSYNWTIPSGATLVDGQGTPQLTLKWEQKQQADLCVTVETQCDQSQTCYPVTVNGSPDAPVISAPNSLCPGETAILHTAQIDANDQYNWILPPQVQMVTGAGTNHIEVAWASEGEVQICLEVSNSCGTNVNCVVLATADSTYFTKYTCNVQDTGLVIEHLVNVRGCDSLIFTTTYLKPIDECSVSATYNVYPPACFGEDGIIEVNITTGTGPFELVLNSPGSTSTHTFPSAGMYEIPYNVEGPANMLIKSSNGLQSSDFIQLTLPDPLQISAQLLADFGGFGVQCFGDSTASIQVNILSGGTAPLVYEWSNSSSQTQIDNLGAGHYSVTVTDAQGCTAIESISVNQPDPISYEISKKDITCFGENNGSINIIPTPGNNAEWMTSLNGSTYSQTKNYLNLQPGYHQLTIEDKNGCTAQEYFSISEPDDWKIELGPDASIDYGDPLEIVATLSGAPTGAVEIKWSDDNCFNCSTRNIESTQNISLHVQATDENGCISEDQITITVVIKRDLYVPNAFSPDGDHVNDIFFVSAGATLEKIEELSVYDRWGNRIFHQSDFHADDPSYGWDGTYRGKMVAPGVYTYRLTAQFIEGIRETRFGDVTIVR